MGLQRDTTEYLHMYTHTHTHTHTHINYINILFSLKKKKDLKHINQTRSGVRVVNQMELSLSALDISVLLTFPF